ncbi:MAG: hypothetical protein MHM6MM_001456 [Cercozoa sp. M6MM]
MQLGEYHRLLVALVEESRQRAGDLRNQGLSEDEATYVADLFPGKRMEVVISDAQAERLYRRVVEEENIERRYPGLRRTLDRVCQTDWAAEVVQEDEIPPESPARASLQRSVVDRQTGDIRSVRHADTMAVENRPYRKCADVLFWERRGVYVAVAPVVPEAAET